MIVFRDAVPARALQTQGRAIPHADWLSRSANVYLGRLLIPPVANAVMCSLDASILIA